MGPGQRRRGHPASTAAVRWCADPPPTGTSVVAICDLREPTHRVIHEIPSPLIIVPPT